MSEQKGLELMENRKLLEVCRGLVTMSAATESPVSLSEAVLLPLWRAQNISGLEEEVYHFQPEPEDCAGIPEVYKL